MHGRRYSLAEWREAVGHAQDAGKHTKVLLRLGPPLGMGMPDQDESLLQPTAGVPAPAAHQLGYEPEDAMTGKAAGGGGDSGQGLGAPLVMAHSAAAAADDRAALFALD